MDAYDKKILDAIMHDSRLKWSDLAATIGLSAPATADRVNRLIEKGVIKHFGAILDAPSLGSELTAFVAVSLERPEHRGPFLQLINELVEVQECHHIAGEDDYLLKIRSRNTKDLDRIISHEIKSLHGIIRTKTTIVMDSIKESTILPLPSGGFSSE
ncbi:Lrp/AsnC family transcriptional regulator [Rossellomorea sp. KS-H15a]|uniref:Lrp/AsnC family transcriptional regulator n=1 Tax=Rossellomorea sp. KS-H15a TaxID=2963940 RepID=UPI0020C6FCDE|nr:Lrp/AsnC family transcriptional regulator [Rossellomorea sp. KS-H15a]UTE78762.1 Lrp/AsnC family transcriptional regulator [Rossellomorea sp. KS-H15a]